MEADGGQEAGAVVGADGPADHPIIVDAADGADAAVAIAAAGVDWDDRLSWEDSERFEEDSLCSWLSEPESLIQNWRGWSSTDAAGDNNGAVIVRNHHGNVATGPANADVHGGGAGAVIIPPGTAGGSHRHHHHHSAGGGGGTCGSPDRHHLIGGSNLNYNGGLAAGARANAAEGDVVGGSKIFSLVEMTSREVARSVPFELVERFYPPVPETLQLRVAFWSFPENEQDIRLYSCLANGNVDEFQKGEQLYRNRVVRDVLQIGFHLSGLVYQPAASSDSAGLLSTSVSIGRRETSNGNGPRYGHHHNHWVSSGGGGGGGHGRAHTTSAITSTSPQCFNVAVTLDRRRITSCTCTCQPLRTAAWCSHVVAVCLHRIRQPETVCLRAPVSESLSRLQRDQLQKFAQYLISELPRQILPTAQRLLDDLLSQTAQINTVCGAPDPTAGASINEISWWCLEDSVLHENIRKILVKFCQPSPTVFSDVNYLSSSAPPAATEWQALMRPLRGREPEGLWNLLSIVKEMYKRRDSNSAKLLRIITTECLNCDQVVLWWYHTKLSQSLNGPQLLPSCALLVASNSSSAGVNSGKSSNGSGGGGALGGQANSAQYSCASLLDEIVTLWRLLVLNPSMSPEDRHNFAQELRFYHCRAVERVYQILGGGSTVISAGQQQQQRGGQNQENAGAAGAAGHHGAGHQNGGNNRHHHHNHHHHGGAAGGQGTHHHYHHSTALYVPSGNGKLTWETARFDSQTFPGFLPALEACLIDWMDYPIDGVTYETARGRSPSYGSSCGYLTLKEFGHGASGTSDGAVEKKQGKEEKAMTGTKDTKPKKNGPFDEIDRLYLPEAQVQEDNSGDGAVETAGQERRYSSGRSGQQPKRKTPSDWVEEAFRAVSLKKEELEILTARCESLHAHGYTKEAVELAAELAGRLMRDPPDLMMDVPVIVDWSHVKHASAESGTSKNAGSSNKETMGVGAGNSGGGGGGGSGGGATVSKSGVLGQTTGTRKKKRSGTVLETPTVVQQETIFIHPKAMEISEKACATLAKAMFLFSVLADDAEYRPLAFQIGLWALELPRQAAASKLLEVKMHYQESEIVSMLKQLPLEAAEMETLRQRAHRFRSGVYHRHHHSTSSTVGAVSSSTISTNHSKLAPAVPPLSLAIYVFESLSWPSQSTGNQSTGHHNPTGQQQAAHLRANAYRAPGDEQLAFEAAAAALAMKSSVSEAENPLLCEGIRRLKGDISLTLLLRYKDQQEKLALIMDRLLDQEMHQMYKHHNSNASFYGHYIKSGGSSNATSAAPAAALSGASTSSGVFPTNQPSTTAGASCQPAYHPISGSTNRNEIPSSNVHHDRANAGYAIPPSPFSSQNSTNAAYVQRSLSGASPSSSMACFDEADSDSVQNNMGEVSQLSEALDDMVLFGQDDEEEYDLEDDLSGRGEDDGSPFWTGRDGEAANSGDAPAHSANTKARQEGSISDEVASAVSSSTAMSTSDDSSSSGISTRGGGSGNTLRATSGNQGLAAAAASASASASVQGARPYAIISGQENGGNGGQGGNGGGVPAAVVGARGNGRRGGASATGDAGMPKSIDPLNKACYVKLNRHRRYVTPSIPNQPSEAHAHFIMELAKRLLIEAGGSHSTAIFTSQGNGPQANQGHGGGPHRQLHLCAFQIGLYSLGIHNKVTPNWLSRTYSSHVSWISGNAMEIGRTAIRILIDTWENHLTPTEAATLADKASQSRDPGMIQAAAELALSTLPQAHALNPTEIYRALAQCKEQPTTTMLEKACLAVEQAAKDYGVYPEVLFRVAQTWYQLYLDSTAGGQGGGGAAEHHQQQQQQQQALIGHFGDPQQQQQQQSQQQQHYVGADAYASFPPAMPAHHHNAYGAVKAPPMRPPPPSACPPPPAPLLQQQMAAPYGLQQFVSAAPTGLTYLPLRPPTVTSAASGPPATFAVIHHANGSPYQPRHHSVPVASLHHPPTTQHIPPPQHPPPRQPYLNQAAAMMNVYHHQNPYAAAQLAAAAAAAAAVSRNYVGPIVQHHQQRQMPYRAAQPQLLMPPHSQHSMAEQYHLAQFAAAHGHPQHQLQSAPASERHVDQAGGQSRFLYAAYRVGMLALETLGRRINDDRAFTKYGQNPPYGDDVKWLLKISKRLGLMYVQQFCLVAAQSVPSPFVLWDLASEAAMLFSRSTTSGNLTGPTLTPQNSIPNPAAVFGAGSMGTLDMNAAVTMAAAAATMAAVSSGVASQSMGGHPSAQLYKALMHPHVQPLVQRCLQMFYAAAQQKLSHPRFMPADTEEVCALVKAARTAFLHTPGGNIHFHEFLQSLRRQKACKKDVWNKILSQVNG